MSAVEALELVAVGVAAGFLAGLLGVGGGVVLIPAMVLLLGFDQHVAQGTSLLVIIPSAAVGTMTHHRAGRLRLADVASLAVGGVAGALIGSVAALSVDDLLLRRLFAALLLVVGGRMLLGRRGAVARPAGSAGRAAGADGDGAAR